VQVENNIENNPAPTARDCAFGTFVKVESMQEEDTTIIGLIIDTILIDRDQMRAGPRMAPDLTSVKIMFPEFIDERIKVVKILLIGYIDKNGRPYHLFPDAAPHLNDSVNKMDDDEIKNFHIINNKYQIGYYSAAIGAPYNLVKALFLRVLPRLETFFPDESKPIIRLIKNNLEFKMKMEGGFA
jgi:hypothetical protein